MGGKEEMKIISFFSDFYSLFNYFLKINVFTTLKEIFLEWLFSICPVVIFSRE